MYGLATQITAEDLSAIAAQLYVEMLKAGYTAVAEFHYLHDAPSHDRVFKMSEALMHAAEQAGIRHTLLPVLYQTSNFGGALAEQHQRRFVLEIDDYLHLLQSIESRLATNPRQNVGIAFHSLRAVPPDALSRVLDERSAFLKTRPVHIHIAEQTAEVDACLAWSGQRPVEWLLDHAPVDVRWCLVHATHMLPEEIRGLAASKAVAGLCPTTEANLGDGVFPLQAYLAAGGKLAVGSDSHVSVSPIEELRWLEYVQRLMSQRRNIAADESQPNVGSRLWNCALVGGEAAIGQRTGAIAPGHRADFLVLDTNSPQLFGTDWQRLLDRVVFSGNVNTIRHVVVGGKQVIVDGRHAHEESIEHNFRRVIRRVQYGLQS